MQSKLDLPKRKSGRIVVIGVAGGIASGKTAVASELERLGAVVFDADQTAHQVLDEPEVREALRVRWGGEVFNSADEVDRRVVARIVFADPPRGPAELEYLEQVVHPQVEKRFSERLCELEQQGRVQVVVLDAPLLFEAGWNRKCDIVLFAAAPRQIRLARALRRGWSEAEFLAREGNQGSLNNKRRQADLIIDTSTSIKDMQTQLAQFWQSLEPPAGSERV